MRHSSVPLRSMRATLWSVNLETQKTRGISPSFFWCACRGCIILVRQTPPQPQIFSKLPRILTAPQITACIHHSGLNCGNFAPSHVCLAFCFYPCSLQFWHDHTGRNSASSYTAGIFRAIRECPYDKLARLCIPILASKIKGRHIAYSRCAAEVIYCSFLMRFCSISSSSETYADL